MKTFPSISLWTCGEEGLVIFVSELRMGETTARGIPWTNVWGESVILPGSMELAPEMSPRDTGRSRTETSIHPADGEGFLKKGDPSFLSNQSEWTLTLQVFAVKT